MIFNLAISIAIVLTLPMLVQKWVALLWMQAPLAIELRCNAYFGGFPFLSGVCFCPLILYSHFDVYRFWSLVVGFHKYTTLYEPGFQGQIRSCKVNRKPFPLRVQLILSWRKVFATWYPVMESGRNSFERLRGLPDCRKEDLVVLLNTTRSSIAMIAKKGANVTQKYHRPDEPA